MALERDGERVGERTGAPPMSRFHLPRSRSALRWVGALALVVASAAIWLHAAGPGARAGYDFASYLQAARAVAAGQNPYHRLALEYASHGAGAVNANGYVYPPLLATALAIPVLLGLSGAQVWIVWNLLGVAALGWMASEVARALHGRRTIGFTLLVFTLTLLPAIATYDLSLGQADLLVMALATGALAANGRGGRWAALPLGLAIAVKPQLGLLLGVWLWRREWRAAVAGGLIALSGALLPFAAVGGVAALQDYLSFFLRWNALRGSAEYINQSLYGALLRLLTPNPYAHPLLQAAWLVTPLRIVGSALAVGAWLWRTPRRRSSEQALALAQEALAFPDILLVSPLSEDIHYCLLIAPLVILGVYVVVRRGWRWPAAWALWALAFIFCLPRAQELIYPTHLVIWPGQQSPVIGALITQARSDFFLLLAIGALAAGLALPFRRGSVSPSEAQPTRGEQLLVEVATRAAR